MGSERDLRFLLDRASPTFRRAPVSTFLLGLWFALISADRIDLIGGAASFHITPFLVLTPVVALAELARRWRERRTIEITGSVVVYAALATALLALAVTSSVLSLRVETSAPRVALLVADVIGALVVALLIADRADLLQTLATAAIAVLPFFIIANIAETRWLIGRGPELWRLGPMTIHFDELQAWGLLPRLPGLTGDANRTGYLLAVYWSVIARGEQKPWRRRVGLVVTGLLIFLTLSRSTALAVAAATIVGFMTRSRIPSAKVVTASLFAATILIAATMTVPRLQRVAETIASSQAGGKRLSLDEGSARSHIVLIQRGIEEGASSISNGLIGIGYGNAYVVLQDIFPDNRYGNFHSLYVSMFAEMGIAALLLIVILVVTPVLVAGPWRPLAAGAMTFNIFYQTTAEPVFWFVIATAWLTLTVHRARANAL